MSIESFIAWRYLKSKRKMGFITIISLISIIGVMIGTAALIVVLSVFNGFNGLVTSLLVGFDPHIRIEKPKNENISNLDSLERIISGIKEIKSFSPVISEKAMIITGQINRVIIINGVDDKKIGEVSGVKNKIINGKFEFEDNAELKSIVLGLTLADRLGVIKGDTVFLVSSSGMDNSILQFSNPKVMKLKVIGIFESNNKDYDNFYAYISLSAAKELFDTDYSTIEVRLNDINNSLKVKKEIENVLPAGFTVLTWYDLHKDLYSIMKIERWVAYIILCLIIAVATFNILGSLTMTVIEKKRDIGVMISFGFTKKKIARIFMLQGLLVGVIGTVLGCLLGLILCILQIKFGLFPLDPNIYIISALPVELRWTDFIYVSFASILICFLATIYPSKRAANLLPIDAIRWE
ncbi:MAG TPA: ABC transporter permease [Bacteroidota bacterium]|nr:ABC transporter permease [Bacteroidota bacterium]